MAKSKLIVTSARLPVTLTHRQEGVGSGGEHRRPGHGFEWGRQAVYLDRMARYRGQ